MEDYTDTFNAERLVARHGNSLRYVDGRGWLLWTGKRWEESKAVIELAKETVRSYGQEVEKLATDYEQNRLCTHLVRSLSFRSLAAMVELAKTDAKVAVKPEDFDKDTMLFNCLNGTIDLRTGVLRPHNPLDLITKLAPVAYVPGTRSDLWDWFLTDIFGNDCDLLGYIQKVFGYALTGDTREHAWWILEGAGRNGKSVLMNAIMGVMGDYGAPVASRELVGRGTIEALPRYTGVRLGYAAETASGAKLDCNWLKTLTGGDILVARRLYGEGYSFQPQMKLFLATNNRPEVNDESVATWERIKRVPFKQSYVGREDRTLEDRLKEEREAILVWLVQGCLLYRSQGIIDPGTPRKN